MISGVIIAFLLILSILIYFNYGILKEPSENDVKEYFSKMLNIDEADIEVINIQRCVENENTKTSEYYVIEMIVQKNTSMVYYYNLNSGKYSKHLEYISDFPEVFKLFVSTNDHKQIITISNTTAGYVCVPINIEKIEHNDTNYHKIAENIEYSDYFIHFELDYFRAGVRNSTLFYISAYGRQDSWGTRFDFVTHDFIIDISSEKVYHWDSGGID